MEIDWDTPARLDCFQVVNDPRPMPAPVEGTLRGCLEAWKAWPRKTVPTLHTDRPVMGKTVFDSEQMSVLLQLMGQR